MSKKKHVRKEDDSGLTVGEPSVKLFNKRVPLVSSSGHGDGPEVGIIDDTPRDDVFQVTRERGRSSTLKGRRRYAFVSTGASAPNAWTDVDTNHIVSLGG